MYERFYNLRERPFALSPDPDYLFPSKVHREALSYLRYGIEGRAGFIVITGEIGSGKTTLLQTALRGLDRQTSVARVMNTMLDARELIEAVMLDFGLEPGPGQSKSHLLRDLAGFLVDQRSAGRLVLLVVDEAQNLSLAALEEVRMLSNLETEKSKLIQIVLIGQPDLRDALARPALEQLRQRVTVRYHLRALDSAETCAYINHRLRRAAVGAPLEFSRDVTDLIHLHSKGLPRMINVIADAVLLFGYGEGRRVIGVDLTHEVVEELEAAAVIAPLATAAPVEISPPVSPPVASPISPRVASPVASTPAATDDELRARETRLVERERQLIEQQRILGEQYRLARLNRPGATAQAAPLPRTVQGSPRTADGSPQAPPAAGGRPTIVRTAAPAPRQDIRAVARSSPDRAGVERHAPESLWARVRRGLLGEPKPVGGLDRGQSGV